ncbi:MAG TPA: hypothetical protein VL326_14280 [Kofleriaceae bacterium]|nr:hypothetical protein [Kofleriaceae bacterium]
MTAPLTPPPPRSIKTIGTLNLVFAGLGLLGSLMTYAMYFGGLELTPGHPNPVKEATLSSPTYMSFLKASMVAGLVAAVVLGASGIGLRAMKNWGRKLALFYAVYGIFAAITGMVMMVKYLMPALSKLHDPAAQGGMMGGVMGGLIGIAYPVVILVFMSKQNVREAFERANEPPVPPAHVR